MKISYTDLSRSHVRAVRDHRAGETVIYSVAHAAGAFANESRVRKCKFFAGDQAPLGALATVVGSIGPLDAGPVMEYGYYVRWDADPEIPVFVRGCKLELAKP